MSCIFSVILYKKHYCQTSGAPKVIETLFGLLRHMQSIDVFVVVGRLRNRKNNILWTGQSGKTFFEENFVKILHKNSECIAQWNSELPNTSDAMFKQQSFVGQK
jgi:hypothetical protein